MFVCPYCSKKGIGFLSKPSLFFRRNSHFNCKFCNSSHELSGYGIVLKYIAYIAFFILIGADSINIKIVAFMLIPMMFIAFLFLPFGKAARKKIVHRKK